MKGVLITGGSGFIGSHLIFQLIRYGYKVFVLDSLINSSKNVIDKINKFYLYEKISFNKIVFFEGDVRDDKKINQIFKYAEGIKINIECVIHLAGLKSIKDSIKNPELYWDINVNGTKVLLKEMTKFKCSNIIFSSSATIYDGMQNKPFKEDSYIKPSNPYGQTKLEVEKILLKKINTKTDSINPIILRYFNPIGSDPSGIIGERIIDNASSNNLFPNICNVAKGEINELIIYGNDWPTKDGTAIRDFIHISDLASAHIAAMDYQKNKVIKERIFNIGTGIGTSVLELLLTFERVNNIKINYKFDGRREGDFGVVFANCDLARKLLHWSASKNINDMCKDGWNWMKKN